ncbi:hypothetical protein FKM82_028165 [Ascaphus truei]
MLSHMRPNRSSPTLTAPTRSVSPWRCHPRKGTVTPATWITAAWRSRSLYCGIPRTTTQSLRTLLLLWLGSWWLSLLGLDSMCTRSVQETRRLGLVTTRLQTVITHRPPPPPAREVLSPASRL